MDVIVVDIISFHSWEVPDQHISRRTTMVDMTPYPQGSGLNRRSPLLYSTPLLADRLKDPTFWEERRLLVGDPEKELDFVGELAERDSRNHLIWHHRRWVVEKLGSEAASKELESTKRMLWNDAKIYQAWSHREWIIEKFGGSWWLAELQYCHEVLEKDIFNIFAWDQRCRAVRSITNMDKEVRDKEVNYAKKAIQAQPWNESPWRYLKCLYMEDQRALFRDPDLERVYVDVLHKEACRVEAAVQLEGVDRRHSVVDAIVDKRGCVHALYLILDLIVLGYRGSKELSRAVNVLHQNCLDSCSVIYPDMSPVELKVFRDVCSLALSLDAERIYFCDNYRGFVEFQWFHSEYVDSLQKDTSNSN